MRRGEGRQASKASAQLTVLLLPAETVMRDLLTNTDNASEKEFLFLLASRAHFRIFAFGHSM